MTSPATTSTARDWTVQDSVCLNNCQLKPGMRLSIIGERGSFTFQRFVTLPDGRCWLDVIGGAPGAPKFRSFRPARIGKVENGDGNEPLAATTTAEVGASGQ